MHLKILHRHQVQILLQKSYEREEKPTLKSKVVGTILKLHIHYLLWLVCLFVNLEFWIKLFYLGFSFLKGLVTI